MRARSFVGKTWTSVGTEPRFHRCGWSLKWSLFFASLRVCIDARGGGRWRLGASPGRRSGQRACKSALLERWGVPGSAWHFTGCRSRGSPTLQLDGATAAAYNVGRRTHLRRS